MALSVVEILQTHGEIDSDALMSAFVRNFDPSRGYGPSLQRVLRRIREGEPWREVVGESFEGQGSYGNGSAMRVGPLGAYFADDIPAVVEQARRSSLTTHQHPEAVAGAVTVALATAHAWREAQAGRAIQPAEFLGLVLEDVPESEVQSSLRRAQGFSETTPVHVAASILGNGSRLSAQDTVPFCLWSAAQSLGDYEQALWRTVSAGGDRDTTCAIVGSIVALSSPKGVPHKWQTFRESLPPTFSAAKGIDTD